MHSLICYGDLSALLKAHGQEYRVNAKKLADSIGVQYNTVRRWRHGEGKPDDRCLLAIAKTQAIPFELLVRLRSGIPTWYNLVTRRMAYSPFEKDFVNRRVIQHELFSEGVRSEMTLTVRHARTLLDTVLKYRRRITPESLWPKQAVVAKAAELAAPLNLVAHEPNGTYAGHLLTFPLKGGTYRLMQTGLHESCVGIDQLEPLESQHLGALHIYSFYACNSHAAYVLLQQMVLECLRRWDKLVTCNCHLSRYPVTEDGIELADKLGLVSRSRSTWDDARSVSIEMAKVVPELWEAKFGGDERAKLGGHKGLDWIPEYRRQVRV
jgi:hypothetical protein